MWDGATEQIVVQVSVHEVVFVRFLVWRLKLMEAYKEFSEVSLPSCEGMVPLSWLPPKSLLIKVFWLELLAHKKEAIVSQIRQ